jgi:hypothetical protein
LNLSKSKSLEPFLDRFILVEELPNQLSGVVFKHQENQSLVDAEIAFSNPG